MSLEPRILKESFRRLESHGVPAVAYFYGRLFTENPRLRTLFPPAMDLQRDRLLHALTELVGGLDDPASVRPYLEHLGRSHRKFGVRPEHYPALRSALLATLRRFAGADWTFEAEAAWAAAFDTAAATMVAAAERDAAHAPPWWVAEVVEHERRTRDVAVLTLRPGRPLEFAPGQHLTVQTARWPRVWRPYSIANAPRPDGLLRLHVRAVPGGWVSGALVRHTGVGDTLLLGPALGGMTPPEDADRDLLLVAGGTGLAPLRAIIEHAASTGRHRRAHLLVAARTADDLYDLPGLRLLEASCPWLRVVPVLSDDPGRPDDPGGPDGGRPRGAAVTEALERLGGDWTGHEVYLAGPAGMVRTTAAKLRDLGVAPERIHHELREAERQEEDLTLSRARGREAARGPGRGLTTGCPVASATAPSPDLPAPEPGPKLDLEAAPPIDPDTDPGPAPEAEPDTEPDAESNTEPELELEPEPAGVGRAFGSA
ncbi:globin domain-containing protein [Actinomadura logoneensis]|uniref:globin domain-containing protein n=1 Tax=Actinomadura logoneensis TaxID=2293572 RepID=UPI0018F16BE4|nr:globin domain-containing protein [Actinomadura logoneensis]